MMRRGMIATVAAWAAFSGLAADAQARAARTAAICLTSEEAEAAALMMLPGALKGLHSVCDSKLPADAYLRTTGSTLGQRFTDAAKGTEAAAGRAVARMMGMKTGSAPESMRGFFEPMSEMLVTGAADKLTPQFCARIDRALALLDPLPPRNFSGLVEMLIEVGAAQEKDPPFTICTGTAG